jgi:starch phosphorylase
VSGTGASTLAGLDELRSLLDGLARDLLRLSTPETAALFRRVDAEAMERLHGNASLLVRGLTDRRLQQLARDRAFLRETMSLASAYDADSWWQRRHGEPGFLVAYFSMEFGLHECLPLYSGGLGILAGDHLKSAAELGVPTVGVGLFYRRGYFHQEIDDEGRQVESYPVNDPERLPLTLERDEGGGPLLVDVELGDEPVRARVWRAQVGRSRLYLLDTDVGENGLSGREVTGILYGGDREHRIRQEILLGVGGVRALAALRLEPSVFHINEGHAAFACLERLRVLTGERGLSFAEALARVRASTVFTTHTPVSAGNERFPSALAERYLHGLAASAEGCTSELLALGQASSGGAELGMTELALRTAARANGVSRLHGDVAREMWAGLWPGARPENAPIGHVTNGVHASSWISAGIGRLLSAAGIDPAGPPHEQAWERALDLDPAELWQAHLQCKRALLEPLGLDPALLTIGFARRFATYKRADLIFSDPARILALVMDESRPLQVVLAGKAHPADRSGKEILAGVARVARESQGRIVLVPDYDIAVARQLVQGVDLWLNTPRCGNEASGTSGMKAGMNGVLNLSILDGWWREAYAPSLGWAIDERTSAAGDEAERAEVLRLLEGEVRSLYYERRQGLPLGWLEMMKSSIATVGARFSAARMLVEYVEHYYLPAHREGDR